MIACTFGGACQHPDRCTVSTCCRVAPEYAHLFGVREDHGDTQPDRFTCTYCLRVGHAAADCPALARQQRDQARTRLFEPSCRGNGGCCPGNVCRSWDLRDGAACAGSQRAQEPG